MTSSFETIRVPNGARHARARVETDAAILSLDGAWRFAWSPTATADNDPSDAGETWGSLQVPGHWQLHGHGKPIYTNFQYPFPVDPPHVPEANPTGDYRTTFTLPDEFSGGRTLLRFDGVDSWFELWMNGVRIGDSSGSRLTVEFDVTDALVPGENLIAVRVHQWSFASYVEDQDQWWLSGIFRSVTLLSRPEAGIDDVFVHADYADGSGSLLVDVVTTAVGARVAIPELGVDVAAGERVEIPGVIAWSAENPRLYDLVVTTPAETATLAIGFRTIAIEGGVFTLNGAPITFRGVNRHDFDPRTGRAVSRETMEDDVRLMKTHNINALRTSHYPPDPYLLDLCDRYGLYVIDECDIETHGFSLVDWRGNPSSDPDWAAVYLDRMERMVERDKNHASIIMWSLGNEAHWGENLAQNAAWTKLRDADRPIHYEQDAECESVDVYSRMYATFDELDEIGRRAEPRLADAAKDASRRAMPMIQCEYAHAMGNGPGGLADYEAIIDAHPRLAGAFVWEWFDHGLETRDASGNVSHSYGGDFGERVHDGSFIIDGLLLPDRTPSPALTEFAAVIAPFRFDFETEADGGAPRALRIENRLSFTGADEFDFRWSAETDGVVVATGSLPVAALTPLSRTILTLPDEVTDALAGATADETFLNVWAQTNSDTEWAASGHRVAAGQVAAGQVAVTRSAPVSTSPASSRVHRIDGGYRIAGGEFDARGRLRRLGRTDVSSAGMDAWRAPTENDRYPGLEGERPMEEVWRDAGLDRLEERVVSVSVEREANGSEVLVSRARVAGAATDVGFDVSYRWRDDNGSLALEMHAVHTGEWRTALPRLGYSIALHEPKPDEVPVSWFGLGPGENYPDSKVAAQVSRYDSDVKQMQTDYVVPQENGVRMDTRWVELGLSSGRLRIEARSSFAFAARPWSNHDLDRARHAHELAVGSLLWVHLDTGVNGLGSAACGPAVRAADRFISASAALAVAFR